MTLKVRRILSLIFIIIFIVITPAVMLYAAGYRLSPNGFAVERTGMFIIDSKPRGAKIFLNGRVQKDIISSLVGQTDFITTPAKIKNLLPGEYTVAVEFDGYWSWQKKLTVYPGASTFAENIYLFKNDLPAQIAPAKIQSFNLSPDKSRALILSPKELTLINLSGESQTEIKQTGLKGESLAWSVDGRNIAIDGYVYDLTADSKIDFRAAAKGGFNYKWSGDTLYWQDAAAIYRLDRDGAPKKIKSLKKLGDYLIKDGYLYLINKSGSTASLEAFALADETAGAELKKISLPFLADYVFINAEQNLLNLYDRDHEILYLINPFAAYAPPLIDTVNRVKTAYWLNSGNLLYANDFEIWLYDFMAKEKSLLTRISDPIKQAIMHPSKNYIIFSTGKTIKVIELDDREKRNSTELLKFDSIGQLVLSPKGDVLYFPGRIGNSEGLYKLFIQ